MDGRGYEDSLPIAGRATGRWYGRGPSACWIRPLFACSLELGFASRKSLAPPLLFSPICPPPRRWRPGLVWPIPTRASNIGGWEGMGMGEGAVRHPSQTLPCLRPPLRIVSARPWSPSFRRDREAPGVEAGQEEAEEGLRLTHRTRPIASSPGCRRSVLPPLNHCFFCLFLPSPPLHHQWSLNFFVGYLCLNPIARHSLFQFIISLVCGQPIPLCTSDHPPQYTRRVKASWR